MSGEFERAAPRDRRLALQAGGGDDYELCVCMSPEHVAAAAAALDVPLNVIGRITAGPGLRFVDATGVTIPSTAKGYLHFS
jgi:thiamine-monophosphate kinase